MRNKETIKLLVDAHLFDQEFQGTRTFVRELYRAMIGKPGIELFFTGVDTTVLQQAFPGVPAENFIPLRSRSSLFRLLVDIPRIIKHYRIDYAHFQYIVPPLKHCRYIVTTHDVIFREYPREFSFFYRFFKTMLYRFGAASADICTTVSDYSARSITKYLGVRHEKIVLTPLAVDEVSFALHDKAALRNLFAAKYSFDKFILCVSRFEARKNHLLLLDAFVGLGLYRQGYYLVLLGHRSLPIPEFDKRMEELDDEIRSFIIIRNDVTDDELTGFYRTAMVFVYPSKAEGFGLPPLEAAAAQTPVICSNATAMRSFDFFGRGHIDPNDADELVSRLTEYLHDPPDEKVLQSIAQTVRQRYSWQAAADRLYHAVLSNALQATPELVSP